ncbi:MAG: phosphatidate cytidylyltransferase [Bacteriovoracaceae bacterium]
MSNNLVRVLSAIVLIIMVIIFILSGKVPALLLVSLLGIILVDELCVNFLNRKRTNISYILSQLIFASCYGSFFISYFQGLIPVKCIDDIVYVSLALSLVSLLYLFCIPLEKKMFSTYFEKVPWMSGVLAFILIFPVGRLFLMEEWKFYLGLILIVNYGMDAGAWLSGTLFGKTKLWVAISPKKTVEGLIGGMIISALLGGIYWLVVQGKPTILLVVSFLAIALLSQLGDLVQSKIKRQVGIKDSSSLIPGHGGVYDRIDSLVFVTPFYLLLILKVLPTII